jgi:HD-like signal output (HDOD) protein
MINRPPTSRADGSPAAAGKPRLQVTTKMLALLAPLPATAIQMLNLLADPEVSLRRLSDVAVRDVGIASALLRCANSATFGLRGMIGSVVDAIRVIGTAQTRMLVLASGVAHIAQREMPIYGLPAGSFTRHSELAANIAMSVARGAGFSNIGIAYSGGLLHDLGKVVLSSLALQSEQRHGPLKQEMEDRQCGLLEAEEALYGVDHASVGRQLAELWSLPADMADAIGRHHQPLEKTEEGTLAYCVLVSNGLAGLLDRDYPRLSDASSIELPGWLDIDRVCEAARHCGLRAVPPQRPAE